MPFKNCKRKEFASLSYSYQVGYRMHRLGFEEDSIEVNRYFKEVITFKYEVFCHLPQVMI
jgi:hypothetical protein